jgi:hypothetical protein
MPTYMHVFLTIMLYITFFSYKIFSHITSPRRGRGDEGGETARSWQRGRRGDGAALGAAVGCSTVSALRGSSDGRRRCQIWSPRLAGVTGDGLGRHCRRSADLAGGWLAAAMVADVAATKLATTAADCGACRDAGPRQEPRRHEGGAAPSSMLRL